MRDWYLTRDGANIQHRGVKIDGGRKIRLTPEQAKLHNKNVEQLIKTEPPKTILDCGCPEEHAQWLEEQKQEKSKPETKKVGGSK